MTMNGSPYVPQDIDKPTSNGVDCQQPPQVFPPSALTLRLAIRDETIQVRTATYASWTKGRMGLEQYPSRDAVLDNIPASNNGKLCTWILVPRDYPKHPYLASCETYKRESLVIRSGDTTVSTAVSYGIASVFTPERFRENGYARLMLQLLHYILAPSARLPPFPSDLWGTPPLVSRGHQFGDALFSVLYSDAGAHFYGKCGPNPEFAGWDVRDPWSVVWQVSDEPSDVKRSRSLRWLTLDDLEGYLAADRWRVISEDLPEAACSTNTSSPATSSGKLVHITTPPAFTQISFLVSRYILTLREPLPRTMHWGAAHTNASGEASYMTWVPERSTLMISRMRCDNLTSFGILLHAAIHQARQLGLSRVEIWNTMDWAGNGRESAPYGGTWVERSEHLPAFAWYGEERKQDVIWHLNERYRWLFPSLLPEADSWVHILVIQ